MTDVQTAEPSKLAANAFLATKISFIDAMAEVGDVAGADVAAVADVLGYDDRIGRRFLDAGVGFGDGCLPKDVRALTAHAADLGARYAGELLAAVDATNQRMRDHLVALAVGLVALAVGEVVNRRRISDGRNNPDPDRWRLAG